MMFEGIDQTYKTESGPTNVPAAGSSEITILAAKSFHEKAGNISMRLALETNARRQRWQAPLKKAAGNE
jgi:hypothetical protein